MYDRALTANLVAGKRKPRLVPVLMQAEMIDELDRFAVLEDRSRASFMRVAIMEAIARRKAAQLAPPPVPPPPQDSGFEV